MALDYFAPLLDERRAGNNARLSLLANELGNQANSKRKSEAERLSLLASGDYTSESKKKFALSGDRMELEDFDQAKERVQLEDWTPFHDKVFSGGDPYENAKSNMAMLKDPDNQKVGLSILKQFEPKAEPRNVLQDQKDFYDYRLENPMPRSGGGSKEDDLDEDALSIRIPKDADANKLKIQVDSDLDESNAKLKLIQETEPFDAEAYRKEKERNLSIEQTSRGLHDIITGKKKSGYAKNVAKSLQTLSEDYVTEKLIEGRGSQQPQSQQQVGQSFQDLTPEQVSELSDEDYEKWKSGQ